MTPEEMLLDNSMQQTPQENLGAFDSAMEQSPDQMLPQEEDDGFLQGKVIGIPTERLLMLIQQEVQNDPEGAQEVMQNIAASGLSRQDIEDLGMFATVILRRPETYPMLLETIKADFPETKEVLTGDLEEDDDILTNWVIAAYLNEGGVI